MSIATRRHGDAGSTLLLFPSAVLVVLLLSAIAVDLTLVHTARRELERTVQAAADDAAALLDLDALHRSGIVAVDLPAARRQVATDVAAADLIARPLGAPRTERSPDGRSLVVRVRARIDHVLGGPFGEASTEVEAVAVAELVVRPPDL